MHKLEIPENIPLKWELFKGSGAAELFKTCVLAVLAVCPAQQLPYADFDSTHHCPGRYCPGHRAFCEAILQSLHLRLPAVRRRFQSYSKTL